jgi:hypothetical protein
VDMDHIYHVLAGLSALAAFWWRFASSKKEDTAEYRFYIAVAGTAAVVILGNEVRKWLLT